MRLPSPALSVSVAALVVALGGTSYAAGLIGGEDVRNNSLTGKDVRNNSLTGKDVRNNSLTGKDVRNGSLKAKDLKPGTLAKGGRWVLVNAAGQIEAQSGGFEVEVAYDQVNNTGAPVPAGAIRNVYIDANEDLTDNGLVASIALQNQVDQSTPANSNNSGTLAGADMNPEFSGEITLTRCAIPGVVVCAPAGTNEPEYFVVSPRNSDGSFTENNTRKRFYVILTGDSSDYVKK